MIELALVGVPNTGKSTFFKAVTLKNVEIANYPFTTIEPNEGIGFVTAECLCRELDVKCKNCKDGIRFIPVKIWDVAGLVKDAHLGRGRGNAFLDDLRQASALIHVLDISGKTDSEGNRTENFDPLINVKILEEEMSHWMLGIFKKDEKIIEQNKSKFVEIVEKRFSGLGIKNDHIKKALEENGLIPEKFQSWTENEKFMFVASLRKISKPIFIAANKIDVPGAESNLEKIKDYPHFPCSAEVELALRGASKSGIIKYIPGSSCFEILKPVDEKRRKALECIKNFLEKYKTTGIQDVLNKVVFEMLNMIVVYPVADSNRFTDKKGVVLPDAFLVKKGTTTKEFAYLIHEDIGKTFITAVDARTGKNIGAEYELKHNDIISIKAGVI